MEKPTGRSTEQPAEQRAEQPAERPAGQQVERTAGQPTDNAPSDDALRCSADPAVRCSARASRPVEVARNAAGVVAALVMVPLVGLALLLATVDEGYVAGEPSEAGDRVVIVEHHFLLLSSGDVYLVPAGSVTGECIASFSCDDTYSPGYAGSYRVTWNGRSPHVQVWSDSAVDGMVPLDIEASSADAS